MSVFEVIDGCEGQSLSLDGTRIAGPKPWGGGTVAARFETASGYGVSAMQGNVPSDEWNLIICGLVAAHYDNDEERFKRVVESAERKYDEAGMTGIAEFLMAQHNPGLAFIPM